jgi:hypothetical protein
LVLLLVGMACATVFESTHGTEMALGVFYRTRWFESLLALLALNLTAAVIARYPFSKRHIGFVITHASIIVIMGGALITARIGIDGQVGMAEGQTVRSFNLLDRDTLTITNRSDSTRRSVDLTSSAFRGFAAVDDPKAPVLTSGDLTVEIVRYLPDSETSMQVVDDNPMPSPAVEASLSAPGHDHPVWLFANRPTRLGSVEAGFRVISDATELTRLLSEETTGEPDVDGVVKVDYGELKFDVALSECLEKPVPLGELSYSVRVLRYLPHAIVGADNKLTSASNQPVNPAVEVELIGPEGPERRLAFARFPEFSSMHGEKKMEEFKVTFVAPRSRKPTVPLEVLSGPSGDMYARFCRDGTNVVVRELTLSTPVETPWPEQQFTLTRRFDHAREQLAVTPKKPGKKGRTPAILLRLSTAKHNSEMWLQKYDPYPVTVDGVPFELVYANKTIPLGFALTLDSFTVGYYPGGNRPRSFESQITIDDPTGGGTMKRVVSMNNPAEYGGYSLYQSMYRQEPGRMISFLSVARDPGLPIVFTGYIGVMVGMVIVLGTRMVERRRLVSSGPLSVISDQVSSVSGPAVARQNTDDESSDGNGHSGRRKHPLPVSTESEGQS